VLLGAGGFASVLGGLMAPVAAAPVAMPAPEAEVQVPKSIVYIGMNEAADHEVKELRKRVGHDGVSFIAPGHQQDVVRHNGVRYDLKDAEGVSAFVDALGLTGDRAEELKSILGSQGEDGKDELAKFVVLLNEAENGERSIERIVFSGHSVGSGIWGDDNGSLNWSKLKKVMNVFPNAAREVEDVLLAACYSGGHRSMDDYRAMFPNLKTIWAYDGSAPGAWSGAVPHILRWERGTRATDDTSLDRNVAEHTRKGENVATWTLTEGYDNGKPPRALEKDTERYDNTLPNVENFRNGTNEVEDTQRGPLRNHYNNIQRLLSRPDLPDDMRANLEQERDFTIRLIYFKNVKTFFQDVHSPSIDAGFSEMGLAKPDFSTMTRKQALETINNFNEKYDATDNPSETATYLKDLLNKGLKNLHNDFVPEAWI